MMCCCSYFFFFFSSRRRHTRFDCDWSSDVCSSDLAFALCRYKWLRGPQPAELGVLLDRCVIGLETANFTPGYRNASFHSQRVFAAVTYPPAIRRGRLLQQRAASSTHSPSVATRDREQRRD